MRITGPDGRTSESISDQESIILGSGSGAGVRIADPRVSNLHAMLKVERNGVVKVIDLGSELGTLVAGRPVVEPRKLNPGDIISVGGSRVEVLFQPAGPAPRRAFDPGSPLAGAAVPALQLDAPPRRQQQRPDAPAALGRPALARRAAVPEPPTPQHHALQVSLLWGDRVLDVQHFADGAPVRIGDSRRRNDFQVFSASVGTSFRLAVAGGGKVALTLPRGARVWVSRGGQPHEATGTAAVTLGLDERARIEVENVALLVRQVR
ncbi:MAG TPA: FHA domain-containing protein, partial [Myxococcales bacterium]|nr:FHA domain-containing protein [Myxococcales bacterium]